ncbi:hypothetical protein Q5P01_000236 [Channa striata]|uniref:Peptidase S1 domain-containing protein n=1 Tax=Channa striata TaxID=64152 RepID=A0AA88IVW4_CHASR|nr:hypothetical protein Q5P01_000236 [Channa striata]
MASYKVTCALTLLTLLTPAVVCGQAPLNTRVLGPVLKVTVPKWPWMASLQKDGRHVCGGTLVDEDSVLSSDDCFSRLGLMQQCCVWRPPPTLSNYIQPICVDNGRTFSVGSTCWAAGWSSGAGGEEQVLQEIQTSVVDCEDTRSDSVCTEALTLEQDSVSSSEVAHSHIQGSCCPLQCELLFTLDRAESSFIHQEFGSDYPAVQETSRTMFKQEDQVSCSLISSHDDF